MKKELPWLGTEGQRHCGVAAGSGAEGLGSPRGAEALTGTGAAGPEVEGPALLGLLVARSLSRSLPSFPRSKLPRMTFEFLSVSSKGMIVLYRREIWFMFILN